MLHEVENDIGSLQASPATREHDASLARTELPAEGRPWSEIRAELIARKRDDYNWRAGRVPIYVYHDTDELKSISLEAYGLYFSENALGGRAFPSLARMEEEVVQMALSLFSAPEGAAGSFTSGGTESIFLAVKTARDRFRSRHSRDLKPAVLMPRTAHPAFDKAAHYLDVDVIRTAIGADLRADVAAMRRAVDARTCMIVGSAPCYPYGVFDPVVELAGLANASDVWLHVDACLGGFLAPFARDEGYPIPEFDLSVSGVSSLSADLHKYGFAARGASVLLYRSAAFKAHQGFRFDNWPRGTYATETFPGSRPGGAVASAWAVSQYLGRAGYRRLAKKTMEAKQQLMQGIAAIRGLEVLRPTDLSIVLYRSTDPGVDINAVADAMGERGWFIGRSREPQAIHMALNSVHLQMIDEYLHDLQAVVRQARAHRRVGEHDDNTY